MEWGCANKSKQEKGLGSAERYDTPLFLVWSANVAPPKATLWKWKLAPNCSSAGHHSPYGLSFSSVISLRPSFIIVSAHHLFIWTLKEHGLSPLMFNTLLKKASESSFAALASEALDSRPGSPAAARRPPGSPLAGQQQQTQQQNGSGSPARKVCISWMPDV